MKLRYLGIGFMFALFLGLGPSDTTLGPTRLEARTNQNFTTPAWSAECSRRARRHADRHTTRRGLRNTAAGAISGAALGGLVGQSGSSVGTGALIGGGAGMIHGTATSRWQTLYNRRYMACINDTSLR